MRSFIYLIFLIGLIGCGQRPEPPLELVGPATIYTADKIYTGTETTEDVHGLLIDEAGVIRAVFSEGKKPDIITPALSHMHFDGIIYPGFVDGHAHLAGIGVRELTLDLSGIGSIAALVARIEAEVQRLEAGEVLIGRGWIETDWPEARMPNAADIDPVSSDNPVLLTRADGHALLANRAAMTAAGIMEATPDPAGGQIERDAEGAATGLMIDNAMGLFSGLTESPSEADLGKALETGARLYASRGWTGVHNMSVSLPEAPIMQALSRNGNLPQRVYNAYDVDGFNIAAGQKFETDTVLNRSVKIYMDGALGSRGALLFQPYSDRPETKGLALRGKAETMALFEEALTEDVQMAVHAIGDKANSDAIDWIGEAMVRAEQSDIPAYTDHRWRIEHAQILRTQDIPRLARLGIIASMQPSHAIGDLKFAPDRLGSDRLDGAYAWKTVLNQGGLIVGGSDAPVEFGSPLIEFYAAIARKTLEGTSGKDWSPEEVVSREEALAMFTKAPAFASFQEDVLGTLEVGKLADITVFDRDIMVIPEAEILDAKPLATLIAGKIVWQAE